MDRNRIRNLGILNTDYKPGDSNFGIPYPDVFVVNAEQRIVGKIFVEGYSTRVDANGVLSYAVGVLH